MKNTPEKINLWDRFFNRYRKEIVEEGQETWFERPSWAVDDSFDSRFTRHFVKYKVIDRVTGSETIKKEYLT